MVTDLGKLATIEARAAIWVQGGGARNFLRVKARRAENDRDQQIFQLAAFIAERHPCGKFP